MIGKTIAHYEIVSVLGKGGMGEVYRAHDPRTGRDVAIKSLPPGLGGDAERLARFRREARTLASLSHRNIAGLYGVEEQNGHSYLVMELAEGLDLAQRIAQGPLPLHDALDVALQIAEGLEEAHEKGVIHRDLKPANVRIDASGLVKILDFGLARAVEGASVTSEGDPMLSPTITAAMTHAGTVLGTAAYMSPEQARGRSVDRRCDLWSFGVILWEMLTGRRLFQGDTISDTIASVLKNDPDWDALPKDTPNGVRRLLERCLERDVRSRLRDIGEARIRLERWKQDPSTMDESFGTAAVPVASLRRRGAWLPWTITAVACLLTVAAFLTRAPSPPSAGPLVAELSLLDADAMSRLGFAALTPSPDGRHLMWSTERGIYLRRRDDLSTQFIPTSAAPNGAAFSPDSRWIAYDDGSIIYRRAVEGGASVEVFRVQACRGLCWADDRRLVIAPTFVAGLLLVDVNDGSSRELTTLAPTERSHRWPAPVPGHDEILFMTQLMGRDYQESNIEAVSLTDGRRRVLHHGGAFPRYAPTGHLLYVRGNTLLAVPYTPGAASVRGVAIPVLENLFARVGDQEVDDGSAQYGFDDQGTLIYRTQDRAGSSRTHLAWLDIETGATTFVGEPGEYEILGFSPDGTNLGVRRGSGRDAEIVMLDFATGSELTLSVGRSSRFVGTWSGDGTELFWTQPDSIGSAFEIVRVPRDGSRSPRAICTWPNTAFVEDASPDGRWLLVSGFAPRSAYDLGLVDLRRHDPVVEMLVTDPTDQGLARFSPDGRLMLHGSGVSAQQEFLVRRIPDTGARWRVGDLGGADVPAREMHWGPQGDRIYEIGPAGLYEYPVRNDASGVLIGSAVLRCRPACLHRADARDSALHPDGRRMIVLVPESSEDRSGTAKIVLRTEWFEDLRRSTGEAR